MSSLPPLHEDSELLAPPEAPAAVAGEGGQPGDGAVEAAATGVAAVSLSKPGVPHVSGSVGALNVASGVDLEKNRMLHARAMTTDGIAADESRKKGLLLCARAVEACELESRDFTSKNDPYVVLRVGVNRRYSKIHPEAGDKVRLDTLAKFPVDPKRSEALEISIFDHDSLTADDLIGEFRPDPDIFRNATEAVKKCGWFDLTRNSRLTGRPKIRGKIYLELWFESFEWPKEIDAKVRQTLRNIRPFPMPTLRLVLNWNYRGGVVKKLLDGGAFKTFPTYQLNLWDVNVAFTNKTNHWNENYPAAQKIFGKGPRAAAVRQVIRMQHKWLYSKSDHEAGTFKIFHVCGMHEFLEAICFGKQEEKAVRFTYVILEDSAMHFSVTSAKTGQDLLSKHALHSCCSRELVYAGEFFIDLKSDRYKESGAPALVIDNNSGTYAPDKEGLISLKLLLELNLGYQYPIFVLDREDPRLKLWFAQNELE